MGRNQYISLIIFFFDIGDEVVILSESACSFDIFIHHEFVTSLFDLYNRHKIEGDDNCPFRAL